MGDGRDFILGVEESCYKLESRFKGAVLGKNGINFYSHGIQLIQ